jgi:hypothetical protein
MEVLKWYSEVLDLLKGGMSLTEVGCHYEKSEW